MDNPQVIDDNILIPKDKLLEGFELEKNQIRTLLKSSRILYAKKKYSVALSLSILAYEEIAKLGVLENHIKKNTDGISKKEWNDLVRGPKNKSVHENKLGKIYRDGVNHIKKIGMDSYYASSQFLVSTGALPPSLPYSQVIQENDASLNRLEKLNAVKQDCFYLNWKNNDWFIFNQLNENEQESVCYIVTFITQLMFNTFLTSMKFPAVPVDPQNPIHQAYVTDPVVKETNVMEHKVRTPEFVRKNLIFIDILEKEYKANSKNESI